MEGQMLVVSAKVTVNYWLNLCRSADLSRIHSAISTSWKIMS